MDSSDITVDLDDELMARLRLRAEQHGHSADAEACSILNEVLGADAAADMPLHLRIQARFAAIHQQHGDGPELLIPSRQAPRVTLDVPPTKPPQT